MLKHSLFFLYANYVLSHSLNPCSATFLWNVIYLKAFKKLDARASSTCCSFFKRYKIWKPRPHENFFACTVNAIFFKFCRIAGGTGWPHER